MSEIFRGRIKEIVRGSDLATLSSKKIREQLEEEFKTDLSKRKKEIDDIVMALLISESQSEQSQNATADDRDDSKEGNMSKSSKHKKKKKSKHKDKTSNLHKRKHKDEDSPKAKISKNSTEESEEEKSEQSETAKDEELARILQEEEEDENQDGGRRGLRARRKPPKTSKTKEPKKTPANKDSMFKKEMVLSPELADIMGTDRMARSEVVRKMWQIVKDRDLRDPSNKQYHICDDQLMKVFGLRRVRTFSMMKYLKTHVKDPALLTDS